MCKCKDCKINYDNNRDYPTSICDECFKKYHDEQIIPLTDKIKELQYQIHLKETKEKDVMIDIKKMLIVIMSFEPRSIEGEEILKEWLIKYDAK